MPTRKKNRGSGIEMLATVALADDVAARGLRRGEVGTVVELLGDGVYEVEFCDDGGETYAQLALPDDLLIRLHNQGKDFELPSAA